MSAEGTGIAAVASAVASEAAIAISQMQAQPVRTTISLAANALTRDFEALPELGTETEVMTNYLNLLATTSGVLMSYANVLLTDVEAFKAAMLVLEETDTQAAASLGATSLTASYLGG